MRHGVRHRRSALGPCRVGSGRAASRPPDRHRSGGRRAGRCRSHPGGRPAQWLPGPAPAVTAAGVPVDPSLVRDGDYGTAAGLRCGRELLRLPDPPTAVFTCNDGQALGVYRAAAEAGLNIPRDLSVVGFDDLPPTQWTVPPLTTVHQPLTEMAATAATMVISLAKGESLAQTRVELATELVIRDSTAPPRSGDALRRRGEP
ncbi:substrate-binding domain-containing protein [Streptomyces sp. B6B3]|uniref:substrate-binding domain-containing protein n=1 Tax=Streptomyces sp. B6B3 TaxID=3153570 RepID=UPI00325EC449